MVIERVRALDADALFARAAADGELRLAVRHWTGGLRLAIGDTLTGFTVQDGVIGPGVPEPGPDIISIGGPAEVWAPKPDGLTAGEHELDVTIALRIPYIVESGHPLVMRERCVKTQSTNGGS